MAPLPSRHRLRLGWSACLVVAVIGALIWLFWVAPAQRSVERAEVAAAGQELRGQARAGERIGVWASGRAAILGSLRCTLTGPDGQHNQQRVFRGLDWDDTLWWATPRTGFAPYAGLAVTSDGEQRVRCVDSLGPYEAEYLLADDVQAPGVLGLGRGGSADFSTASLLAAGAVMAPLIAVLLALILLVQEIRTRRRRRGPGASGGAPD